MQRLLLPAGAILVVGLAGCGGGGGSTISSGGGGGGIPAPAAEKVGSAEFTVDARTGAVTVKPLSDSRAAFGGNALSFTSSILLSEGSPERRVLKVTAKNNTQETIGQDGSFRVLFSNFRNDNTTSTDLRSTVRVASYWGTGLAANSYGPLSTASIFSPNNLHYEPETETLFATSGSGTAIQARQGTASLLLNVGGSQGGFASGPGFTLVASTSAIALKLHDEPAANIVGSVAQNIDGDFAVARFTALKDIHMVRATGPNDFVALVADGTRLRRVTRTPSIPAGEVTTLITLPDVAKGVAEKNGLIAVTVDNRVLIFKSATDTVFLGSTTAAFADGLQANLRFSNPNRLRWVGDNLFVADTGNQRIRQLNLRPGASATSPNVWWGSTISGTGAAGTVDGTGTFITHDSPTGLTKGIGEELFVSDTNGSKVRRVTPISGRFSSNFNDGTPNPTELPSLSNGTGFAPSIPVDDPYITEETSIAPGSSLELGEWQFSLPEGVKTFSFVVTVEAETAAHGVLPSALNTGSGTRGSANVIVRGFAGQIDEGYADGPLASSAFRFISGMAMAQDGTIFVADYTNHAIRIISKSGIVSTIVGGTPVLGSVDGPSGTSLVESPYGLACNPAGTELYFTQLNHVVRVAILTPGANPSARTSWTLSTIAGLAGTSGNTDYTTGTNARFLGPGCVIYGAEGTIYVLENQRIRMINKTGPTFGSASYSVRTLAGVAGTSGYLDGGGITARFNDPVSAAMTPTGDLLVTDAGNKRVRRVTPAGMVSTFAGSGTFGYIDSVAPLSAMFRDLRGITVDKAGYTYVFDGSNSLVRRISPSGVVSTVAGTALTSGNTDGPGNSALLKNSFSTLLLGPGGDLYLADVYRIRLIQRIINN